MPRTIDDICKSISTGIEGAIYGGWFEACLFIEVLKDVTNLKGEYLCTANSITKSFFEVDNSAFDDVEELHEISAGNGISKWSRAKFTLLKSGRFNIDFE